jgi:hypothetical protein
VKYFVTALLCLFALGAIVAIFKGLYNDRQRKDSAREPDSAPADDCPDEDTKEKR